MYRLCRIRTVAFCPAAAKVVDWVAVELTIVAGLGNATRTKLAPRNSEHTSGWKPAAPLHHLETQACNDMPTLHSTNYHSRQKSS